MIEIYNTDEDLGSATGLPPFDGRLSSNNPNTDVLGDNPDWIVGNDLKVGERSSMIIVAYF
jgi:hypothetical protein